MGCNLQGVFPALFLLKLDLLILLCHTYMQTNFGSEDSTCLCVYLSSMLFSVHLWFSSYLCWKWYVSLQFVLVYFRWFCIHVHTRIIFSFILYQTTVFVLNIDSSFLIIFGHLIFTNFHRRPLWNMSIFFSLVFVNVHISLSYRRLWFFVYRLIFLDLKILSF